MRKTIVILLISFACIKHSNAQLFHQLKTFNYSQYLNHPINDLLAALPSGYTVSPVYARHISRYPYASQIWLYYPNNINLKIVVKQFTHMNPYSVNGTWDINLFRKEDIFQVFLYGSDDKCVVGCLE